MIEAGIPRPDGASLLVEHPDQCVGERVGFTGRHRDVGARDAAGGGDGYRGEIGRLAGPRHRLRHPKTEARPVGQEMIVLRSEEHTSELQSLMRSSYAVFCLKKKTTR